MLVTAVALDRFDRLWQAILVAGVVDDRRVLRRGGGVAAHDRPSARAVGRAGQLPASCYPLARVLGPLPQLLILVGNALTPGKGFREGPFASEAELRELVDLAEENSSSRTASGR